LVDGDFCGGIETSRRRLPVIAARLINSFVPWIPQGGGAGPMPSHQDRRDTPGKHRHDSGDGDGDTALVLCLCSPATKEHRRMTIAPEPPPARKLRGFAEFTAGEQGDLGTVDISGQDVVDFARDWDPQPFHLDADAGRASPLGGHAASGWHTASLLMRLIATGLLAGARSMGSGGVRNLAWKKPVLVGERLTGHYRVTGVRPSSRGDRGYVDMDFWLTDRAGDTVTAYSATVIVGS
jgi:acyl dehydratase